MYVINIFMYFHFFLLCKSYLADHTSFEIIGLVITKPILSVITGTDSEIYKKKKKKLELMGHDERYYFE